MQSPHVFWVTAHRHLRQSKARSWPEGSCSDSEEGESFHYWKSFLFRTSWNRRYNSPGWTVTKKKISGEDKLLHSYWVIIWQIGLLAVGVGYFLDFSICSFLSCSILYFFVCIVEHDWFSLPCIYSFAYLMAGWKKSYSTVHSPRPPPKQSELILTMYHLLHSVPFPSSRSFSLMLPETH